MDERAMYMLVMKAARCQTKPKPGGVGPRRVRGASIYSLGGSTNRCHQIRVMTLPDCRLLKERTS